MTNTVKVGIVAAALVATSSFSITANAGGIVDYEPAPAYSMKDPGYVSMKDAGMPPSHRCYLRADLGYSWAMDPDVGYTNAIGATFDNREYSDAVLTQFGAGCDLGHRLRGELALTYRHENEFKWFPDPVDPVYTSVRSRTAMLNLYYDFASYGSFTPYVGAGIGFAHHKVENVMFVNSPFGNNPQFGADNYELAWSLMAGVEKQVTPNISIDVGYRYIDMGDTKSKGLDNTGFVNPPLELDNLVAHELMLGVRYKIDSLFH